MTARLLRLAGLRPEVPREREARVRQAVLDECRAVARRRHVRRRAVAVAGVLAAAAAVMVTVRVGQRTAVRPPAAPVVATVERIENTGARVVGGDAPTAIGVTVGHPVRAGDRIDTGRSARLALRLAGGASIRFDRASTARLRSAGTIELETGAIYIDSGRDSPHLNVHTSFGTVKDIGTQFEIRLEPSSMRVRVRSGIVEVRRGAGISVARPGSELMVDARGATSRAVTTYGPDWAWTAGLAPAISIEGKPLGAYLEHVCSEQGWALVYGDAALARESSGIILHGSVDGLQPLDAVAVVLATSGLAHRLRAGELLVTRLPPSAK